MRAIRTLFIFGIIAWLAVAPLSLFAIAPVPMPAFQLNTLDGGTLKSADLPSSGSWLLIYLRPTSHYCDQLLKSLTKENYPGLVANTVFVVDGSVDDTKAMKAKYADLQAATWYADPSGSAFSGLKLHGVPVVLGVHGQTIQWTVNGILPEEKTLRSILNSWIQKQ